MRRLSHLCLGEGHAEAKVRVSARAQAWSEATVEACRVEVLGTLATVGRARAWVGDDARATSGEEGDP